MGKTEEPVITQERLALEGKWDNYLDQLIDKCKEIDTNVLFVYYPYGKVGENDIANVNYVQDKIENAGFKFLNCEDRV